MLLPYDNYHRLLMSIPLRAGDVLSGTSASGEHFTGVLEEWAGGPTWWNERTFVLFTIAVVVLMPLISFRHVGKQSTHLEFS